MGTLFKGGHLRLGEGFAGDTIHGMPCFEAMNIDVALSQIWDLMTSWSDN